MLAPNTLLQNRYLIIRLIGRGGMGAVYQAQDQRLGITIAVKQTLYSDDLLRKAFEREARLLANLRHSVLPKVSDHFTEGNSQFLVMEFIPGNDLGDLLKQKASPFPLQETLRWGDQLLDALEYLHRQHPPIIHRDIKPQNLKLTEHGEVILLDFGLAKGMLTHQSTTTSGREQSIFGYTPNYAPPEQMQGAGTDARSDLYSLAATLYHLMTGKKPSDALTRAMNLVGGSADPLIPADVANPQVPPAVAVILRRAMSLNRDQRLASATELRQALQTASLSPSGYLRKTAVPLQTSEAATVLQSSQSATPATIPKKIEPHPTDGFPTLMVEAGTPATQVVSPSREKVKLLLGHTGGVNCVAVSPDGTCALSGSQDTTIILWDLAHGKAVHRFTTLTRHTYSVESIAFSPNGQSVLSGSRDGTVRLWDVKSGQEMRRFSGHNGVVHSVAFSPDGRRALSCGGDKTIRLWDLEQDREIRRFAGHTNSVMSAVFSPDGNRIISGSYDHTVRLWEVETGHEIRAFRQWEGIWSVVFSSDGRFAVSGGADKAIHLWDVESGQGSPHLEGHTDTVTSVSFSPDGRFLVSGSSDSTVRLWDAVTGQELYCFEGHKYGVTSVAYSPQGHQIVSGSWDKTVRLWEVPA